MGFGRIAAGVATLGGSEVVRAAGSKGGKNLLLGKKDTGRGPGFHFAPGAEELFRASIPGLKQSGTLFKQELDRLKGTDPKKLAALTMAKQETGLRASAQDTIRKGQEAVAQRGLGRSALGLRALTQPTQQLGNQITQIRANKPLLEEQFASQRMGQIKGATGGLGKLFSLAQGGSAFDPGRQGKGRSGGLLGLAAGAAGAFGAAKAGGNPMQGFQAGQGIGQSVANFGA